MKILKCRSFKLFSFLKFSVRSGKISNEISFSNRDIFAAPNVCFEMADKTSRS